ncbi:Hypothetical protein R9X50_00511100 [Acrodontium crateriforme]|uniref:Alpha-galactosidase n=1 Tax=Acrodontium crateriforme TaxID=150365 RepID=A0AAQ3M7C9_9PEZI|nr:Hypothetical protein R9X50_00511100 [Acrodontium crateriforme]
MVLRPAKQKGITFGYCDITTGQRVYPVPPLDKDSNAQPQQPLSIAKLSLTDDNMYCRVTCSPSLGQVTHITGNKVRFDVLIECSSKQSTPAVIIWHNLNKEWAEITLVPYENQNAMLLNQTHERHLIQHWFSAELEGTPDDIRQVWFTVKFRTDASKDWQWLRDVTGLPDGELCYQSQAPLVKSSHELSDFFDDLSSEIVVQSEEPDTDDTLLYSLICPVRAALSTDSAYQHHQLGTPKKMTRWFSIVRLWVPWLAPRHGHHKFALDKDAILISFLRADGMSVVCLGISGVDDLVTTFIDDGHGKVIIKGRNDRPEPGFSRVLVAVAPSFEVANCAVMYHARRVVGYMANEKLPVSIEQSSEVHDDKNAGKPAWIEEWYDELTYCTWNALGQKLSAEKIYNALDELKKANITITNLIIDDNWQSLSDAESQNRRGWIEFEANKTGFPGGLKTTTAEIRRRHPNIKHIAVWHAMLGYWGGISPDGKIAENYKTIEVQKEPGAVEGSFTVVAAEDVQRMYNDFYSFLSASGVDSVKTDAQFFLDMLHHAPDRRALITEYQDAWTLAHLTHFSARAISCMSQTPQIIFHSQLPRNKPRLLVRNSDDFFPDIDASHPWHIFCNAHNSLLTQHLNVLPDWDMFQTSHPWAAFHAAARCVSGGPIYITDTPGQHDKKLITQMTAPTLRGQTVILRPHTVGRSMDAYNSYHASCILKIGTHVGYAQSGSGILGVFNVSGRRIHEFIPLDKFPGTEQGTYVVGSFVHNRFSKLVDRKTNPVFLCVELGIKEWDILTAYSVQTFTLPSPNSTPTKISISPLGLVDKMTGIAALTNHDIYLETSSTHRLRAWLSFKALGTTGLWLDDVSHISVEKDIMVLLLGKPIPASCVRLRKLEDQDQDQKSGVLEVDVEEAWRKSGEKAGWSNEVSIEIFIHFG